MGVRNHFWRSAFFSWLVCLALLGSSCSAQPAPPQPPKSQAASQQPTVFLPEPSATPPPPASPTLTPLPSPSPTTPPRRVLRLPLLPGDLTTLDPQRAEDWNAVQAAEALSVGLVRLDGQTGQILPAAAKSWSINEDGTEFSFFLREDIPWVQSGRSPQARAGVERVRDCDGEVRMVTAVDWKLGLLRLITPTTHSAPAAAFASVIKNGSNFYSGKINNPTIVGIMDAGPYELKLTFTQPGSAGLAALAAWYVRPTPVWMIEGDQCTPPLRELWWRAENYPSYGPFALKSYVKNSAVVLVKNPFWPGTDSTPAAQIDEIRFNAARPEELVSLFDSGALDVLYFPPGATSPLLSDPRYRPLTRPLPGGSSQFLAFRVLRAPTDNARLRQALSLAIDRERLAALSGVSWQPASWLTPPTLTAAPNQGYAAGLGVQFNPQQAKTIMGKYLYDSGWTGGIQPTWLRISMLYPAGARNQRLAEALQSIWKETLGVQVQLVSRPPVEFQREQNLGWHNIVLSDLAPTIPDTHYSLGQPFFPDGKLYTLTGWQEGYAYGRFYQAVFSAWKELDLRKRSSSYALAENILVAEDAVIAPLFWDQAALLVQPNIQTPRFSSSVLRFEFWQVPSR